MIYERLITRSTIKFIMKLTLENSGKFLKFSLDILKFLIKRKKKMKALGMLEGLIQNFKYDAN